MPKLGSLEFGVEVVRWLKLNVPPHRSQSTDVLLRAPELKAKIEGMPSSVPQPVVNRRKIPMYGC